MPARVRKSALTMVVAGVITLALGVGAYKLGRPSSNAPSRVFQVAPFELTDQTGAAFSSRSLAGKVWIANFIFTSCRDICPMLSIHTANIAQRLRDVPAVRFISVSVDPSTDTPAVLSAYAQRFEADPARWTFLTGEPAHVADVTEHVFRQPFEEKVPRADSGYDILHASRLLLVDAQGWVRGFYETNPEGLQRLEADARALANEATP